MQHTLDNSTFYVKSVVKTKNCIIYKTFTSKSSFSSTLGWASGFVEAMKDCFRNY